MKSQSFLYEKAGDLGRIYRKTGGGIFSYLELSKSNVLMLLVSFLLGRVSLFQGMMPFGVAFFAASSGKSVNRILMAMAVLAGMITGGAVGEVFTALAFIGGFTVFSKIFKNVKIKEDYKIAAIGLISGLIPQIYMVYLNGFLLYDFLMAVFYSGLIFSLIFIFRNSGLLIEDTKKKNIYSNEEIISMAVLAALVLSAVSDIAFSGITLTNTLGILAILIFSMKSGPGVGAAVGVIVGLVVNMSNPVVPPVIIGSYAFCGLLAGVFKNLGKIGACIGFIAANALLTLYINGSTQVLIHIKDIAIASIAFIIIPQKVMENTFGFLEKKSQVVRDKISYTDRIKELTVNKLNNFALAFTEISKTFNEISETKMVTNKQDISSLFDRVAEKVCKDCSLCRHCWDRNFYNTYQVMFKIVEALEKKGWIDERDIPKHFIEKCERTVEFVKQINNVYELFKVDMVWKNKVGESRGLVSQQLDGLSKVISNLALEIDTDIDFKRDLEDNLFLELDRDGIKVKDVVVYENKWRKFEVNIFHKGCKGKNRCIDIIEKSASQVLDKKMIKDRAECVFNHKTKICNLKLIEEEVLSITTGVARMPKYEGQACGDNYTFMNTGDGKYVLALSDGMGTGQKASNQSNAAISLLEQFMETGFDKDTAVRLINSILVLKSDEDSFATIDLTAVDLYDGKVEFVKIGAVPTFIKKSEKVEVVKSVSLPAGILSNIETELVCKTVGNGDFIIMVSDGVIDSFAKEDEGEQALIDYIDDIKSINPQGIADFILNKALFNCGKRPLDDMTVVVAKIWNRVH
ncbi:stage II sporulation protein E [Herbivorax sp. ANBcel31]|uniref:stage II sporulation protein E n=1 Tax=Herbivorax sp. ANBcel31 TaxID=3069754 RepID=UPI0027B205F8|nr:stage II sporulation protein E [Herbivorax sp. ANBcel31]MDQ2086509.1 stage II sporulation protein E [Herbivorax sp. ANBcel31]